MSRSSSLVVLGGLLLMALACVSTEIVQSDEIIVDTRSIAIVEVVIEGPGGDLVPVEYDRMNRTMLNFDWDTFGILAISMLILAAALLLLITPKKRR